MERFSRRRRWILLATGFWFAFGCTLLGLHYAMERAEFGSVTIQSDSVKSVWLLRDRIAKTSRRGIDHQILMLGDSMLLAGSVMKVHQAIPSRVKQAVQTLLGPGSGVAVHRFASPGSGYSSFYFLADLLIATGPDQIVLEFSPNVFSDNWRVRWARTDHAAWMGARRIPEALTLPLHRLGLTTDRILWTVACVETGCAESWGWVQREQQRVVKLYESLQEGLANLTGWQALESYQQARGRHDMAAELMRASPPRRSGVGYLRNFREALAGVEREDVALQLLEATVRRFEAAGLQTLVYVPPINVEHMQSVGVYNREGFERTLLNLEASVRNAGGDFLDLHDLVPDSGFRDAAGHLTFEGEANGSELLARRLAPPIISGMKTVTVLPK